MELCMKCKRALSGDEIGIYKRLINRRAAEYLCKGCLADKFKCEVKIIDEKINMYKDSGCLFFE